VHGLGRRACAAVRSQVRRNGSSLGRLTGPERPLTVYRIPVNVIGKRASRLPKGARTALDWALTIAIAVAAVLVFEAEVAKPFTVPSESMEPTLLCGKPGLGCTAHFSDRIVACEICSRFEPPRRDQIIVFRAPALAATRCGSGGTYVKRLIGLPGETVREDAQGFIWIDGKKLTEPYVQPQRRREDVENNPSYRNQTWDVPKGEYFFLGDNRGESCDSRAWGSVPASSLIGPVILTYWPLGRLGVA